jgi:hypothetical protein
VAGGVVGEEGEPGEPEHAHSGASRRTIQTLFIVSFDWG